MSKDGNNDMSSVYTMKRALRRSMLATLKSMPEQELELQSRAVNRILTQSPFFVNAKSIGCYLNMVKGELRTDSIVSGALAQGKKVYTPYLPPSSFTSKPVCHTPEAPTDSGLGGENPEMEMLRLYNLDDLQKCPLDKWGIVDPGLERRDVPEPRANAMDPRVEPLDVILLPGVAFDEHCNRLGRGKAFYDRFLANYTSTRGSPLLVALALTPQVLPLGDSVPVTDSDFTLDGVISPSGLVWRTGTEPKKGKNA